MRVRKPNYYWRLLATGWSFLHLFIGGLSLATIVFPVLRLWPGSEQQKCSRVRRVIHLAFRHFVWEMRVLGVLSLEQIAIAELRHAQGCVVVANHPTLIDVVLLIAAIPDANCIVKSELWRSPYLGGVVRAAGFISNSGEPEQLLNDCAVALKRGEILIIFPEGTRTVESKGLRLQRGAAHIIIHADAEVVPALITCDPPTLKKGEPWYVIPDRKPHFCLQVNDRFKAGDIVDVDLMPSQTSRQLTTYLTEYYQHALGLKEENDYGKLRTGT